jgi:hypothetical protein
MRYFVLELLFVRLRDLIVLTVDATQIAVTKKDISGAARTHQRRLFAKVSCVGRNDWQPPGVAGSNLILQAVVETISWANGATFE